MLVGVGRALRGLEGDRGQLERVARRPLDVYLKVVRSEKMKGVSLIIQGRTLSIMHALSPARKARKRAERRSASLNGRP